MTNVESQPLDPEMQLQLDSFEAASFVLHNESVTIRRVAELFAALSSDSIDQERIGAAVEVATDPDTPALTAVEVLMTIRRITDPFSPVQSDKSRPVTERWTQDWSGVSKELKTRIQARPELEGQLTDWFLSHGTKLVETTYAPSKRTKPLYYVIGAANDQCVFRPILTLASMASPEFREEHGLVTLSEFTLQGEDGNEPGWMKNTELIELLRNHVAERVANREIEPRIIVSGSASRIPKLQEANVVSKYFEPGAQPLYPEIDRSEAEAMLAGALLTYGRNDDSPLTIEESPAADPGELPSRLVSFESLVGPVTFIATTGSEANRAKQFAKVHDLHPELFEDIDGIYGSTTATYIMSQLPRLLEEVATYGMKGIDVDMIGLSAHAAGNTRTVDQLVGELTNYMKAIYNVAERSLMASESFLRGFIALRRIGGPAVQAATKETTLLENRSDN